MVDPWEAAQDSYVRTALVLQHFDANINGEGGVTLKDGELGTGVVLVRVCADGWGVLGTKKKVKIFLLAGGDLIESFGEPGVWSEPDVSLLPALCRTGLSQVAVLTVDYSSILSSDNTAA